MSKKEEKKELELTTVTIGQGRSKKGNLSGNPMANAERAKITTDVIDPNISAKELRDRRGRLEDVEGTEAFL